MKSSFTFTCIIGLALLNVIWIVDRIHQKKIYSKAFADGREQLVRISDAFNQMEEVRRYEIASDYHPVHIPVNEHRINPLQFPAIILFISDQHCSDCVERLLYQIKHSGGLSRFLPLIILYQTRQHSLWAQSWIRYLLPDLHWIELKQDSPGLPLDDLKQPYFFILTPDDHAVMPFMPMSGQEEAVNTYLELVQQQFIHLP